MSAYTGRLTLIADLPYFDMVDKNIPQRIANRFAMSNVTPDETGIAGIGIYISPGQCHGKQMRHGPRVKAYRGDQFRQEAVLASVSISSEPKVLRGSLKGRELASVREFIKLNLEVLLQHWNCELTDRQALNRLKPVLMRRVSKQ